MRPESTSLQGYGSAGLAREHASEMTALMSIATMTATPEVTHEGVVTGPPGPVRKNVMDRFIDTIEWIAAFFVGIVALNTSSRCSCASSSR